MNNFILDAGLSPKVYSENNIIKEELQIKKRKLVDYNFLFLITIYRIKKFDKAL